MENMVCKICGGSLTRKGNNFVCDFCASKWMIDLGDDVHAVERANAWEALRGSDFEKAAELFENILLKEKDNHEAYWGRALAKNGIVYVTDYNENKRVPTCNNITESSFLTNKDVQKAISFAPAEIKEGYQQQAEQIEKIRVEWLNKASKEPPYDIFISYKDSDRENGIERTQDSIDVQDLYTSLVQKGYNVFFSRVTLRGKISEQYEPYIYNAIKTAKVMIVFGEKAEYFNAVWVKNEWSRYKTRIEKGEKHKNSLITVYKDVNPYDLPMALTGGRQALDYGIPSNYEVLMKHIQRVLDESKRVVHLDKIQIKGGQISKKSTQIQQETIKTREVGNGAIAETSIDEKQKISLVHTYFNGQQWGDARRLLEDILFNNPSYGEAIWLSLMEKYRCMDDMSLLKRADSFTKEDFATIERVLNCSTKERAEELLNALYALNGTAGSGVEVSIGTYERVLNLILPFDYERRKYKIAAAFDRAILKSQYSIFKLLLSTLDSGDVDTYIRYNLAYAKQTASIANQKECVDNILGVDAGNLDALEMRFVLQLKDGTAEEVLVTVEEMLKFSTEGNRTLKQLFERLIVEFDRVEQCTVAKKMLQYYDGDLSQISSMLIRLEKRMLEFGYFEDAEYMLSLILTFDKQNADVYWSLCLVKIRAKSEADVVSAVKPLKEVPEYTKYLTMVNEERRQQCIRLASQQVTDNLERLDEKIEELEQQKDGKQVDVPRIKVVKKEIKRHKRLLTWTAIMAIISCCMLPTGAFAVIPILAFMALSIVCAVRAGKFNNSKAGGKKREKKGFSMDMLIDWYIQLFIWYLEAVVFSVTGWTFSMKKLKELKKEKEELKKQKLPQVKPKTRAQIVKELEEARAERQVWANLVA